MLSWNFLLYIVAIVDGYEAAIFVIIISVVDAIIFCSHISIHLHSILLLFVASLCNPWMDIQTDDR